jgi:hypothetical protein
MSTLLTRSPAIRETDPKWHPRRPEAESGPTLEDVVCRAWEVLGAALPAGCPVCGGELVPRESGSGGRCDSCGSSLT